MSLNCQSLNAKFPHTKLLLDCFEETNKPVQVLCLQETWIKNSDLIDMAQVHIENCLVSLHVNALKDLNIYDQPDKQLTSDPNTNYELCNGLLNNARAKHLPKKRVKYQKKLHTKSKWITNGTLNSINKKDKLQGVPKKRKTF